MKRNRSNEYLVLFFACALVFLFSMKAFGESLSFDDAIERLHQGNESLKAAGMEVDQKRHEQDAARGLYFPKVEFSGKYTRIDEPITIDLNDIRRVILTLHPAASRLVPSMELQVQDDNYWQANVSALWPVFTGGQRLAVNRAADAFLTDARERKRSTESGLTSELVRRYFGLQLARHVADTRRQVLAGMDEHLHQVRRLEEAGMVSRAERLHAEVARAEAERELKRATRDEELAQTALGNIIMGTGPIDPASPLFIVKGIEPLEQFRSMALERNPVLKQVAAQKEAAHQAYRKEQGTLLPQIYLFGRRELYKQDLTILEPEWAAGVGMSLPIFEGGTRYNRIESAKAVEQKIGHLEAQARRDIETLVERRYQEVMKAGEQYDVLLAGMASAEENLRVRTRSFEEGFATSLDVVDARLALSRARIELLVAAYDSDVALAELLEAAGASDRFGQYRQQSGREVLQ